MISSHQLAAIMFTDIVGYTAMMGQDSAKALDLMRQSKGIQKPLVEKHNGKWLKEMGDGAMARFNSAIDAVQCSLEIQEAARANLDAKLRIGIHLGDVVVEENDIHGDGVNVASRLESIADPGGICISDAVEKSIQGQPGIEAKYLGEVELKNVAYGVRIYALQGGGLPIAQVKEHKVSDGAGPGLSRRKVYGATFLILAITLVLLWYFYPRFLPSEQREVPATLDKSIAVLPFKDDSEGSDNQYFCDGIMDEILTNLQEIRDLGVKSRTAVERYRNSTQSFEAIAGELDVAFILEGAVRKYGDRFRVTIQLIEVESGNHLWAENYDGVINDTIFVLQSHIAKRIASSLHAVITPREEKRIDRLPTTNMEAYDLLIRGGHEAQLWWRTLDDKHQEAAHGLYNQAIKIDPQYVRPLIGKAALFRNVSEFDSALIYADRISKLDPEHPAAYGMKAEIYKFKGNLDLAIPNYLLSINLSPKDGGWWSYLAIGQCYLGTGDELRAILYCKKSLELSNEKQQGGAIAYLGESYLSAGDYEKAEEYYKMLNELDEGCGGIAQSSWRLLIQGKFQQALQFTDSICQECEQECYEQLFQESLLLNQLEKAEQYWPHVQDLRPGWGNPITRYFNSQIGYVYSKQGKMEQAEKFFNQQIDTLQTFLDAKEGPWKDRWTYLILSRLHAFQGNRPEALKYLAEYARLGFHYGWHDFILIDPFFEKLRDDPEFQQIVKTAQEEKAVLRARIREMDARGELQL